MMRLLFFLLLNLSAAAQDEPGIENQGRLEQIVEKAESEESETELNVETITNKARINECDSNELGALQLLSPYQITQFLAYRKRLGSIISLYELQAIPGWDIHLIERIVPFVSLDTRVYMSHTIRDRLKTGDRIGFIKMSRVMQKSDGFIDSNGFLGGRQLLQFRYSFNHKNLLQWGIAGGNQAGEPISFSGGRTGFDQLSIHVFARQIGKIQLLAIGDFRVNFGQGLICWQGMGFSKSAEVLAIKREAPVFQPSTTGASSGFFRGAGVSIKTRVFDFALFGAWNKKDANIEFDTARSIITSGLRRTETELSHRNNLGVMTVGFRSGIMKSLSTFHINGLLSKWDHPYKKKAAPYNLYAPSGKLFINVGVDYALTISNMHFFGEAALNERHKFALVSGALISLDKRTSISLLFRKISPAYFAWDGNAFTDGSYTVNENGFYSGIEFQLSKKVELSSYYDVYSFPWLKFRVNAPSQGNSFLAQFKYTPDKTSEFYVRLRSSNKQQNEGAFPTDQVAETRQSYLRLNYLTTLNPSVGVQMRFEGTWNSRGSGILLYAEMQKKIAVYGQKVNIRLQYSDTDDYESRIYAYESDTPYTFSITPQYSHFIRYYLNNSMNLKKLFRRLPALVVSVKWSQRFLIDGDSFGSGFNAISGRNQS
ncbi:MAG TPA: hypothetical protein VLC28_08250, partial [Flavitalea sp.]|nr:hypothetical protein [Flavitalea sp.]